MILVTGGTGLVGSHLLYYLVQNHHNIRATYRNPAKLDTVKHVFSYYSDTAESLFDSIEWVACDITDIPELTEAFKEVTHVYHCAAMVSFDPNDYYQLRNINIEGTANIVNFCVAQNVEKLCYVSSVAALGSPENGQPITESTEWNQEEDHNVYAITKYGAEMEVWRGTQEGLEAVIVNPGVIIGPGYWNSSSGYLFKKIFKGLSYYSTGVAGYIDVHDVVKGMIHLMKSPIKNERFVMVAENWSFKDFSTAVAKGLHVKAPHKKATYLILQVAWRLDWLRYAIQRNRRTLTKQLANTLNTSQQYSSASYLNATSLEFRSIDASISETSRLFSNDFRSL